MALPTFVITVTGKSELSHMAELATLEISISETAKTLAEAYTSVLRISATVKAILSDKTKPSIKDGIASWTMSSITNRSFDTTSFKGSSRTTTPRVGTSFYITFEDFVMLGQWAVMFATMSGVKVEKINWTVQKGTRASMQAKCRMASAVDALRKAEDYAQALGIEKDKVQPLELKDSDVKMNACGANGDRGLGMLGELGSWEVKTPLVFATEQIEFKNSIDAKFAVNMPDKPAKQ